MSSPCPCGCGRKIEAAREGAAAGLARMDEALPVVREVIDALLRSPETAGLPGRDFGHRAERFLESGEELRRNFVAHTHGSASPSITPELVVLQRHMIEWIETAGVMLESALALRTSH